MVAQFLAEKCGPARLRGDFVARSDAVAKAGNAGGFWGCLAVVHSANRQ